MPEDDADGSGHGVPLLVDTAKLRVLCVGGGVVATGKLAGLINGGARARVVAPRVSDRLAAEIAHGRVRWLRREYLRGDIGDAHLVIAGTGVAQVNSAVAADADADGRLCIRVDHGGGGTAAMMGAVHRDALVLAVATSGRAPALARLIRSELAERYGPEHGDLVALAAELRNDDRVAAALSEVDVAERRARWRAVYGADILDLLQAGHLDQAKEAAFACLLSSSD